jgi:hypothetical protein
MSKWSTDSDDRERDVYRALVVAEYGPDGVDALDYLGRSGWD